MIRALIVLSLLFQLACHRAWRGPLPPPVEADWALEPREICDTWQSPQLERKLDRITNSVVHEGNHVELLVNGVESWQHRFDNLIDAEVILVKTFIWADDEAGRLLADRLAERARAGALVIVQYDLKGSMRGLGDLTDALSLGGPNELLFNDLPHMARLRKDGVVVIPTNVPRSRADLERWERAAHAAGLPPPEPNLWQRIFTLRNFDHFDHEKYFLTAHRDEENRLVWRAILGGLNIASEYAYGGTRRVDPVTKRAGWRDTDVEIRGPVTRDIVKRFFDLVVLNSPKGLPHDDPRFDPVLLAQPQPRAGDARVRFVWNHPVLGNKRRIERALATLIQETPRNSIIRIQTAYFAPSPRLKRPLKKALRRGRRLAVVTNSVESTDMAIVATATRAAFAQLLRVAPNAALFEWTPKPEIGLKALHMKTASFGACGPVVVGSHNLDSNSAERLSESVVIVQDEEFRQAFDTVFALDLQPDVASRVTVETIQGTPVSRRTWQGIVYQLGWYFLAD